jgi:glycosyltransferase involved in cell wall biosynthesis
MHIVLIPGSFPTEDVPNRGIFFKEQAVALADAGVQVGVIAVDARKATALSSGKTRQKWGKVKYYQIDNVNVVQETVLNLTPFTNIWLKSRFPKIKKKLFIKYIEKYGKPDLIHAHVGLWGGWAAMNIAREFNIPYIITEHSSWVLSKRLDKTQYNAQKKVFENAVEVIAVSKGLANAIKDEFENIEVKVVPNLVDLTKFEYKEQVRDSNQLICVANLHEVKNHVLLLKAFAKSLAKNPQLKLKLVGAGPLEKELKTLCTELNITKEVTFSGRQGPEAINAELNKSGIFVLASNFETFGIVLIEAMATGLPVIATNCGGPADIIEKVNGVLVSKGDVEAFSAAILEMVENYNKYNHQEIRAYAASHFSKEVITARLKEIYSNNTNQ